MLGTGVLSAWVLGTSVLSARMLGTGVLSIRVPIESALSDAGENVSGEKDIQIGRKRSDIDGSKRD